MDGGGTREEGPARNTGQFISDSRRQQEAQTGQTHAGAGARRIRMKGLAAKRQVQQRMGHGVPKRAQRFFGETVPGRGPDLFRSTTSMPGRHGGPADFAEIGQAGSAAKGDEM